MIAAGVDTHKDEHVAVALDGLGQVLGELAVPASQAGYQQLTTWLEGLGEDPRAGVEGTGSYGAALTEHLQNMGIPVFEVERPRRRDRRSGKSDSIDALLAAKRVLAGDGLSTPRRSGERRALQTLLSAYQSCVGERTRLYNQLHALHATAPAALRERVGRGGGATLARRLTRMRNQPDASVQETTILAVLRDLTRRIKATSETVDRYKSEITDLVRVLHPTLLEQPGVGPITAAKLLTCDAARFKNEAAFARTNGTAPIPASSGQTIRHRLNRGGDRQVNAAIHMIALSRSIHHPETQTYLARRTSEGKTKREAMRALKRHLSRTLYKQLVHQPLTS
ncbi:MAG TPA: IS110 family transposase [Solirubrobacteraceae bacterium]|jgi:transposase|nr:IS110 family transposase [Solirubrobacteraceae bacterium]